MSIVRGIVAVLFLAALVAAGVVVTHNGSKVDQAGAVVGYTPPVHGQRLLVVGDSFSVSPDSTQDNWAKLFTDANQMTLISDIAQGTGYLRGGKSNFLNQIDEERSGIASASAAASSNSSSSADVSQAPIRPNWIIMWGSWDDFSNASSLAKADLTAKRTELAKAMQATLLSAKHLVPAGHLIVVGPADGPQIRERVARKLDQTENSVATQLSVPYISPVQGHWFTTDPTTHQDNRGFVSVSNAPTDQGQVHILAEMENALAHLKGVALGEGGSQATDPVPPVLPTTTLPAQTSVSISTVVRTSVTPVTHTVSEPNVTVTPPPIVVTVTVPATP